MRRLPSGIRIGPPWPVPAINKLGPALRALGLFPRTDRESLMALTNPAAALGEDLISWHGEARRARYGSFADDANLSLFGSIVVGSQAKKCLRKTQEYDRIINADPSVLDRPVDKPLFVMGWPRTGTTLLQRLLCQHERARYLQVWEAYAMLLGRNGEYLSREARRATARRAFKFMKWVVPDMDKIHPMDIDDPDECFYLFRNYCAMPGGFDFANVPGYWEWFENQDQTAAYKFHRIQLQILQGHGFEGHWVLKSPQHLSGLPALLKVYPDANIVYAHRDPVDAVASNCSLLAVAWGALSEDVDLNYIGTYVLEAGRRSQDIARGALRTLPASQVINVDYRELTADPIGVVASIYDRFGYAKDAELEAKMDDWMRANQQGRHGRHNYSLADFGLSEDMVREYLGPGTLAAE